MDTQAKVRTHRRTSSRGKPFIVHTYKRKRVRRGPGKLKTIYLTSVESLLEEAGNNKITRTEIQKALGMHPKTADTYLEALEKQKRATKVKIRNRTFWKKP